MNSPLSIRLGRASLQPAALLQCRSVSTTTLQQIQIHLNPQYRYCSRKRHIHSTPPQDAAVQAAIPASVSNLAIAPTTSPNYVNKTPTSKASPLAGLPLSQIFRTFFVTSISSSPALLQASTKLLRSMLESKNPLFRVDTNPILRILLWETFYKQFCAGTNARQIEKTCETLRDQGYGGVILEYALEVLKDAKTDETQDVARWRRGILATVDMSAPGDFVGLKWSGMGPTAMNRMKDVLPPSAAMDEAMNAVCRSAMEKGVALLPAAEETWNLDGFHSWSLSLQRKYNSGSKSVVYNTYQAYLKQTAGTLANHMAIAEREGFTLGVKLVRGAYLGSENRDLIWPNIEGTHHAYDSIMAALVQRAYNNMLTSSAEKQNTSFPRLNVVLATHNAATVARAQALRREQTTRGEPLTPLAYAQLQGMADEVSCSLLAATKSDVGVRTPDQVFKCTTWGSMFECLNYLLRRAAENKDAASRTEETRKAMRAELWRRFCGLGFGGS